MVDEVLARSFETSGEDYDRYRPGFPAAVAGIIVPVQLQVVLDLGAGTGKFTRLLLDRAEKVIAVEPSVPMLDVLRAKLPGVDARVGNAEAIPCLDASVDAVTVAQAFHWFDRDAACAEIARVLRPGGVLGLLWNHSDPDCAWDRAAHRVAHPAVAEQDGTSASATEQLPGFAFVRRDDIRTVESIRRDDYLRRWATVSTFLVADATGRAKMIADIEQILDEDPTTRGLDVLELPVVTDVFVYERV
ncbi:MULTISPECIES: class I SAM-dependent methyltransferase [unclassified Microbacterium]|uniref:class I SAM-dependent methyltransferase n=1 Tax=unclassified Microbacterium TaxID=2609290 RepID=UPI0034157580